MSRRTGELPRKRYVRAKQERQFGYNVFFENEKGAEFRDFPSDRGSKNQNRMLTPVARKGSAGESPVTRVPALTSN